MAKKGIGGRPTKFQDDYVRQAYEACARMGASDEDLASLFGVTINTIDNWKKAHPEFLGALRAGKDVFDTNLVEASLRERATGYSHDDTHIAVSGGEVIQTPTRKHYPPDTTAAIFWLKNRQPDRWRDKQDHEVTGKDGKDLIPEVNPEELIKRALFAIAGAAAEKQGT